MNEPENVCPNCKKSYPETIFPAMDGDNLCLNCYDKSEEVRLPPYVIHSVTKEKIFWKNTAKEIVDRCMLSELCITDIDPYFENEYESEQNTSGGDSLP